ncbi:MAG: hypothetical protein L7R66_01710, partial [Candidatus Thalassarchaeaceae archaeon]|nr:hypothetical protein [Candidatus Thalassarchaeaceae archaeon]
MVTATRLILFALCIISIPIYLVFIVPEGLIMQAAGAVLILLMVSMLLFTGKKSVSSAKKKSSIIINHESDFGDIELPPAVLSEESTIEIRDSKIRRSRRRQSVSDTSEPVLPVTMPNPSPSISLDESQTHLVSDDDIEGMARVHIAKSDPELQAEAEVEQYLAQQRERRAVFRDRLHRERRMETSKRVAEEIRKWSQVEDGEDLSTLTSIPGHGLSVVYEPEEPDPSIPQGLSYVRIDDERVLKVRVSLDVPRLSEISSEEEL